MFMLIACVVGCGFKHGNASFTWRESKIYCISISAIRLRHIGLHRTRTGWKIESPSSVSTMETLKWGFVNQHFMPADKAERAVWNYLGKLLGSHLIGEKNERKVFSIWQERCSTITLASRHFRYISSTLNCLATAHTGTTNTDTLTVRPLEIVTQAAESRDVVHPAVCSFSPGLCNQAS